MNKRPECDLGDFSVASVSPEHQTMEQIEKDGNAIAVRCSCGHAHPVDEGKVLTSYSWGCHCGRIHEIKGGVVDTGWY